MYFNNTGKYDLWENENGVPDFPDSLTEVPDNIALWRLTYDHDTSTLTVLYDGMTDEQAEAQLDADLAAEAASATE